MCFLTLLGSRVLRSYDIMWQDAMADLNEQLHVEGIDQENEAPGAKSVSTRHMMRPSPLNQLSTHH